VWKAKSIALINEAFEDPVARLSDDTYYAVQFLFAIEVSLSWRLDRNGLLMAWIRSSAGMIGRCLSITRACKSSLNCGRAAWRRLMPRSSRTILILSSFHTDSV
jgi:hypothetical protein